MSRSKSSFSKAKPLSNRGLRATEVYQAFRWWGIGTINSLSAPTPVSLSGVPMVGYRNVLDGLEAHRLKFIRRSDGGVSELIRFAISKAAEVYQAFRWWGIGTISPRESTSTPSLSGVPMVGYRNYLTVIETTEAKFIRRSDGGVSER